MMPVQNCSDVELDANFAAFLSGRELHRDEIKKLEKSNSDAVYDALPKLTLIGFYAAEVKRTGQFERLDLLLWMIQNRPNLQCWKDVISSIRLSESQREQLRNQWLILANPLPADEYTAGNIAFTFSRVDEEMTRELLEHAQKLNPTNPRWTQNLARHFRRKVGTVAESKRSTYAELAVKECNKY